MNKKKLDSVVSYSGGKRAIVLLSGGLDSAAALYLARAKGFRCTCLIFDYGQRHRKEIASAKKIAARAGCAAEVIKIKLPRQGSSLLERKIRIRKGVSISGVQGSKKIPNTYVPARNLIFLSFAISYAEATGAGTIFIGAHAQDYSGYPDCRPEFYRSLRKLISVGTKSGVEKQGIEIKVPLLNKDKAGIIRLAIRLGVPLELTWSCYRGLRHPCGNCDSCYYRGKGFREAGVRDPLLESENERED